MNIDITKVYTVIISHGHKDHGGALKEFMKINHNAKIYIKKDAFEPHYIKVLGLQYNVGLDPKLQNEKRIILVDGNLRIDEELFLFTKVLDISARTVQRGIKLLTEKVYVKRICTKSGYWEVLK